MLLARGGGERFSNDAVDVNAATTEATLMSGAWMLMAVGRHERVDRRVDVSGSVIIPGLIEPRAHGPHGDGIAQLH